MVAYTVVVDALGWQMHRGMPSDVVDRLQYVRSNRRTWHAGSGANAVVVYVVNMANNAIHVNTYGAIGNEAIRVAKSHGWAATDVYRVGTHGRSKRNEGETQDDEGRSQLTMFSETEERTWSFLG